MKVHYDWLQDFITEPLPSAKELAHELTMRAFEVEGVEKVGKKYPGVVVGKVVRVEEHPNADRLRVAFVDIGWGEDQQIVCGSSNLEEGQFVPVATIGTSLPGGIEISQATLRGVDSFGMICGADELGRGEKSDGIWVLETDAAPGTLLDEIVEGGGAETVFDIDVLPNRAHDCLSHRGVAREIAALFGLTFTEYESSLEFSEKESSETPETLSVSIEEPKRCRRYVGVHLTGLVVQESPEWLRARLRAIGLRPKNAIVDATNYIMFTIGQPLHAFDAARLKKKDDTYSIHVRAAKTGESLRALDEETYALPAEATVIADAHNNSTPIAVAGVIGGEASAVSESTTEVILEAATFDPVLTRTTSQALKLATDSSKRFENEISPELAVMAMNALVALLKDIAGGSDTRVHSVVDLYPAPSDRQNISLSLDDVNALLGTTLTEHDVVDALTRLSFQIEKQDGTFSVTPPPDRLDVTIAPDVIEEVGRVYGYDALSEQLPPAREGSAPINTRFYWLNLIRDVLIENGFSEVMTYAFHNTGELEIQNPLASDKAFVRSDLMTGVSQAREQNQRYKDLLGIAEVKIFEIGNVYREGSERTALCIVSSDTKAVEQVQGVLEEKLGYELTVTAGEHGVELELDGMLEALPEPSSYSDLADLSGDVRYTPPSMYPYVLRDVAVWVPKECTQKEVEQVMLAQTGELLVNHYLFDEYEPAEGSEKSYAFRLVFQSVEKTLSDEEVNIVMDEVYKALDAKEGWKTR
ncbi:MAG: phenylalanine--tRNA ligase subunit beta [Candidatus Paceibacterota bacterium]